MQTYPQYCRKCGEIVKASQRRGSGEYVNYYQCPCGESTLFPKGEDPAINERSLLERLEKYGRHTVPDKYSYIFNKAYRERVGKLRCCFCDKSYEGNSGICDKCWKFLSN